MLAIDAQAKAMRDERRREEDEARGTRFGQQILDTEVYEESGRSGYLNYAPGANDDEVSFRSSSPLNARHRFLLH